jgi:hypothetical protein
MGSRDSSGSIVIRLRTGEPRSRGSIPGRGKDCSILYNVQTGFEDHPASCIMVLGAVSLGVKWQGRESDHSPPSEVKIGGTIPPPSIRLHGEVLN